MSSRIKKIAKNTKSTKIYIKILVLFLNVKLFLSAVGYVVMFLSEIKSFALFPFPLRINLFEKEGL